jgi:hypothetical protein
MYRLCRGLGLLTARQPVSKQAPVVIMLQRAVCSDARMAAACSETMPYSLTQSAGCLMTAEAWKNDTSPAQ